MKTSLAPSTRRKRLSALDRLYDSLQRQRGSDCLDRLIAEAEPDALEDCLVGFLAQLRNEAAVTNVDKTSTWTSAVSFVSDMLRFSGNSGASASKWKSGCSGSTPCTGSSHRIQERRRRRSVRSRPRWSRTHTKSSGQIRREIPSRPRHCAGATY